LSAIKVGLTGPIGAGKSFVAAVWESLGAGVVEGDEMGRRALNTDSNLKLALSERFGMEILDPSGEIDRQELALRAFADDQAQRDLTRLTFPTLYRLACAELDRKALECRVVVFDAALIYEWGIEADFDRIVVVTANREKLVTRAAARMRVSLNEANRRLLRQMDPELKARRANEVISNDGDEEHLESQAREVWGRLVGS